MDEFIYDCLHGISGYVKEYENLENTSKIYTKILCMNLY